MNLPTYEEFGKIRLRDFVGRGVRSLKNWEYEEELWLGEACGFTEVLRLTRDSAVVRSVSVDLGDLAVRQHVALLDALGLPLRRGMELKQVTDVLGDPRLAMSFVKDRTTHEFRIGRRWRYRVACTLLHKGGLIYVTMMSSERVAKKES
jgi:hypothetical protein